jgi:two-component system, NtrC family, sensor histidine kinase KinB
MSAPGPQRRVSLRTRFVFAGALFVITTIACGLFTTLMLLQLSRVVAAGLRDTEASTAAVDALTARLEREDDVLLLALVPGAADHREQLRTRRAEVAVALSRLQSSLVTAPERERAAELTKAIEAYHRAGDLLLKGAPGVGSLARYHQDVNPRLRDAVAAADRIRDEQAAEVRSLASFTRDEARRGGVVASIICVLAVALSALIAAHLGRVVLGPIRELTVKVDRIASGDFDTRVTRLSTDELGRLGEGFNRMADALSAFRRSSLGELLRANETLRATLAALPDAVLVINADGRVVSLNAEALALFPALGDEGTSVSSLSLPAEAQEEIQRALTTPRRRPESIDLSKAFGIGEPNSHRRLLPRVVPFAGSEFAGAVLVLYDVTELARLDEMRLELVGVASHELRTPVTTLRMTLAMLAEEALSRRQTELVTTALGGVEQLAGTVDEFLDLTRIEAGQLRLHREAVDLSQVVDQVTERFRTQCEASGVTLDKHLQAHVPGKVDVTRLAVVIANLLSNSGKYTPPGGTIVVECGRAPDGAHAVVRVSDSGPGIPEEFRERVFEKFFRVEHRGGTDGGTKGTGIGLYLCRQIVEAHGGQILCGAGPGARGASFTVTLPAGLAARS